MKPINYIRMTALLLAAPLVTACGGSDDDGGGTSPAGKSAQLSISTTILTKAVTTAFASGDRMNLYLKTESSLSSADRATSLSATCGGDGKWSVAPATELGEEKSYLFAFAPYSATASDPSAVPVSIAAQTDYLYSGTTVTVSASSPQGVLTMKHALSILAFNLSLEGYEGTGELTSVELSGIPTQGTLNVSTGTVTATEKGNYTLNVQKTIANGWDEGVPQFFCLPFQPDAKETNVTFQIDGRNFVVSLPQTGMETGMKYVFHLVLTKNGLTLLEDLTEKISLNREGTATQPGDYATLRITYRSNHAKAPQLTGTGRVNGTIYWGDNQTTPYDAAATHTYASEGEHQVTVESWGAAQVSIGELQEVEEIDLGGF